MTRTRMVDSLSAQSRMLTSGLLLSLGVLLLNIPGSVLSLGFKWKTGMKPFHRPTCVTNEPCSIEIHGRDLSTCDCPDGNPCPSKNSFETTLFYNKVPYQFCEPQDFKLCELGQLAWSKNKLHKRIFCVCPEPFALTTSRWDPFEDVVEYKCDQETLCSEVNGTCRIRTTMQLPGRRRTSHLQSLCKCPGKRDDCEETGQSVHSMTSKIDLWQCKPQ